MLKKLGLFLITTILFLNGTNTSVMDAKGDALSSKVSMQETAQIKKVMIEEHVSKKSFEAHSIPNGEFAYITQIRDASGTFNTKKDSEYFVDELIAKAKDEKKRKDEEERKRKEEEERKKRFSNPKITTYGIDCVGCSLVNGRGGTASGIPLDANLGVLQPNGTWQAGITYGGYYMVAADPSVPMFSIYKISNHGLLGAGITPDQPFYAIVVDRGGGVRGAHLDLFIGLESNNPLRRVMNTIPTAELIRQGK